MPRTLTGLGLLALIALAMPAMAQNNPATGQSQPNATMPSSGSQQRMGQNQGAFITQENPNSWRASKLAGVNIYGSNNESIGDVSEVLIDRSGQVTGVVIGVGGFLGIGEKNVAIPFDQVEWMMTDGSRSSSATSPGGNYGSGAGNQSGMAGSSGSRTTDDTTGTVAGSGASGAANRGYPDHGVLRMTKADLQNAPNFVWPNSWTR